MENYNLEIVPIKEENKLVIKDFEKIIERAKNFVQDNHPFEIVSNEDKKLAKEKRANINKFVDAVKKIRLDTTRNLIGTFEEQSKEIEKLFADLSNEWRDAINTYEKSQKEETSKTKVVLITFKFLEQDKERIQKVVSFAEKNKFNYDIKGE